MIASSIATSAMLRVEPLRKPVMNVSGISTRLMMMFPMNKNAQDIMMDAPGYVTDKQLQELHIQTVSEEE